MNEITAGGNRAAGSRLISSTCSTGLAAMCRKDRRLRVLEEKWNTSPSHKGKRLRTHRRQRLRQARRVKEGRQQRQAVGEVPCSVVLHKRDERLCAVLPRLVG